MSIRLPSCRTASQAVLLRRESELSSGNSENNGNGSHEPGNGGGRRSLLVGLGVAALIAVAVAAELLMCHGSLRDVISIKTIGLNYGLLRELVEQHFVLALICYLAAYGVLGLFLIPGSALVVAVSGLLFGALIGIPLSLAGSVVASSLAFGMARLMAGRALGNWTHPSFEKLRAGFQRHALSYMMFLRLAGMPFNATNLAPALIGVPYRTFLLGTIVGLLPSRIALSTAGAGLGRVIELENAQYSQCVAAQAGSAASCVYKIEFASLLTRETIAAFVALAVLALTPAILDAAPRIWCRVKGA